ncbi:insulinoma-associated protein 2-like isoform X2 [Babylonia areolata]|uniref:insulinoma-associated protein 2-like isoform X2 n=1 Tax=Babylonia areolata TaxID=304850 RepID=UPI003FD16091
MPRGFLVKRCQHLTAFSYRERRGSDDERLSDSGSELDGPFPNTRYGSPDSGFSVSPGSVASLGGKDKGSSSSSSGWDREAPSSLLQSSGWDRDNAHTITNSWTTSVVVSSLPLALTSSSSASSSARMSSLSPMSTSSLASPSVRSAPCTPNKTSSSSSSSITTTNITNGQLTSTTSNAQTNNQPSPLTFTAFDTLSLGLTSKAGSSSSPAPSENSGGPPSSSLSLSPAPNSPSRKRNSSSHTDEKSLTSSASKKPPSNKKLKAVRKINFDVDTTSPVSGTIIKEFSDSEDEPGKVTVYGDIEPSFNVVEITPEARAELEKIENKLGDYVCQLCKELYEDAFQLAQHRCSRIVHVEYRCPECDKVFNCPANLASHRRWHKPRPAPGSQPSGGKSSSSVTRSLLPASSSSSSHGSRPQQGGSQKTHGGSPFATSSAAGSASTHFHSTGIVPTATTDPEKLLLTRLVNGRKVVAPGEEGQEGQGQGKAGDRSAPDDAPFACQVCGKKFRRQAYLRKHAQCHRVKPCLLCGKVLLNENERLKHEMEHHPTTKDFACSICSQTCCSKAALDKHVKTSHSQEAYLCKYCDNKFYSSPGLTRHINKCHPTENRQVILLQLPVSRTC